MYLPIYHLNTLPNFRVTRTLFVFAELTNMDPDYNGPNFNFDTIIRELVEQVGQPDRGIRESTEVGFM